MTSNPTINMDELLSTFEWASAGGQFENQAWYTFRDQAQLEALREWCEDNGLLPPTKRDEDEPDQA